MKKLLAAVAVHALLLAPALADSTINNLGAGTTLGGTEQLPMFQGSNPAVTTTPNAIKTFIGQPCSTISGSTGVTNGCTGATTGQGASSNLSTPYVLCRSSGITSHTGDATETTLGTCTIPANAMGANGRLRITWQGECTNDATTKTFRVRWSGIGGTIINQAALTTGSSITRNQVELANLNATNSQVAGGLLMTGFGTAGAAITATVDTTAQQTIVLTGQLGATTTDNIQFDYWEVELITTAGN